MNRVGKAMRVLFGSMDVAKKGEVRATAAPRTKALGAPTEEDANATALAEALAEAPPVSRPTTTYSLRRARR